MPKSHALSGRDHSSLYRNPLDVLQPNEVLFSASNLKMSTDYNLRGSQVMSHRLLDPVSLIASPVSSDKEDAFSEDEQ